MRPVKPRLVVSACLLGERVRYDGGSAEDEFVLELSSMCEVIPVCPEVSIGLGVPRDKIVVYIEEGKPRLSQPSTSLDLTQRMESFSDNFLRSLPQVDGFVLKSKSPSCGVSRTKTYIDPYGKLYRGLGKGLFALEVLRRYPHYPVEDEIRLRDERRRLLFLAKVYSLYSLRVNSDKLGPLLEALKFWSPIRYRRITGLLERCDLEGVRKTVLVALENLPTETLRDIYLNLSGSS